MLVIRKNLSFLPFVASVYKEVILSDAKGCFGAWVQSHIPSSSLSLHAPWTIFYTFVFQCLFPLFEIFFIIPRTPCPEAIFLPWQMKMPFFFLS